MHFLYGICCCLSSPCSRDRCTYSRMSRQAAGKIPKSCQNRKHEQRAEEPPRLLLGRGSTRDHTIAANSSAAHCVRFTWYKQQLHPSLVGTVSITVLLDVSGQLIRGSPSFACRCCVLPLANYRYVKVQLQLQEEGKGARRFQVRLLLYQYAAVK